MIPHVVLCLAYNEKGWLTRIRHQSPILSCSGVYSDTISEITSVVISLMVSLHHCTTI